MKINQKKSSIVKTFPPTRFTGTATALLVTLASLACTTEVSAQTVFLATGTSGTVGGSFGNNPTTISFDLLSPYNNSGPITNGITAVTFGNGFSMPAASANTGLFDNSINIAGTITGNTIPALTSMPISYNFALEKSPLGQGIPGDVTWTLTFWDSVNGSSPIANGTLSTISAPFSGSGNYSFTSAVSSGATFRATLEMTYIGAFAAEIPIVTGTMVNSGFDGQGITLGAIPEPSTYAAIAGAAMLGFAAWRRRHRSAPTATLS